MLFLFIPLYVLPQHRIINCICKINVKKINLFSGRVTCCLYITHTLVQRDKFFNLFSFDTFESILQTLSHLFSA